MNREDVLRKIRSMRIHHRFVEDVSEAQMTPDLPLPQIGLDSIGYAELRILCERKFDVEIPDAEATHANIPTIGALIDLILRHKGRRPASLGPEINPVCGRTSSSLGRTRACTPVGCDRPG